MIAEVYPLKRQSRALKWFDYLVPEGMPCTRGDLVRIPYRQEILWGVVRRAKDKPERGITLKPVLDRYAGLSLREEELSFFEWLAHDLATGVSTILMTAVQHPPVRAGRGAKDPIAWLPVMLPRDEAPQVTKVVKTMRGRAHLFIQAPDIRRSLAIIMGYLQSQDVHHVLILAPTVRDVQLIRSHLSVLDLFVVTGEESPTQRFERWEQFRRSPRGVMVGTRAALLMVDASITSMFVVRAGDDNYRQGERNPRFDARILVWELATRFGCNVFLFDTTVSSAIPERFEKHDLLAWPATAPARVVDMNRETADVALGYEAQESIRQVLQDGKRVLCVHNQKGLARLLACRACPHRFLCPTCQTSLAARELVLACPRCAHTQALPRRCPMCDSALSQIGKGTVQLRRELQAAFPETSVAIVDKEHPEPAQADIVVATTFYHEEQHDPFRPQRFGLVVATNLDMGIASTPSPSLSRLIRDVWTWRFIAYASRAPFMVQTHSPRLLEQVLEDPLALVQEERSSRRDYGLPPTIRWARVLLREADPHRARSGMEALHARLATIPGTRLDNIQSKVGVGLVLDVGIARERFDELLAIFSTLPDRYIIDTSLFS